MSDWKEYCITDVCDTISDTYKDGAKKVVLINTSDVLEGKITNHEFVDNKNLAGQFKKKFQKDDILYSEIRPANRRYAYVDIEPKDYIASTKLMVLRNKPCILPKYLYYLLTNNSTIRELHAIAVGRSGTFPQITYSELSNIKFQLPPIEIQGKILSILLDIDGKIECNQRLCVNLESQAQALFKHWFIDFAPFKDGKFVESEQGMIPEGWRVGTYQEIIDNTISGDWGKEALDGNYTHRVACIRGCDFQDVKMGLRGKTPERYILEKNYASKHFIDKDVLVEISGGTATVSTGRICPISQLLIDKYNGDIVCTNFCRLVRPSIGYSSYLYYSWKYKYDKKVMFGYENGTSGIKNFSIKDFINREPLVIPRLKDLQVFEDMIEHIHTQIQNLGSESAKLSSLRDSLLPKLMSGQIKL